MSICLSILKILIGIKLTVVLSQGLPPRKIVHINLFHQIKDKT